MWKNAWWLTKKEINMQLSGILVTFIVAIFIGFLTTSYLYTLVQSMFVNQEAHLNFFILDLIFLGITPTFAAVFMSKHYLQFQTMKSDPFGKRLAMYRSMPISIDILTLSRILFMLIILFINSLLFYVVIYIALPGDVYLDQKLLLAFSLFWFGYALMLGGVNTFMESGTNGKILFLYSFSFLAFLVILIIFVQHNWSISIVEASILLVSNYPVISVIISLICGISGCIIITKILKKRLLVRDYV